MYMAKKADNKKIIFLVALVFGVAAILMNLLPAITFKGTLGGIQATASFNGFHLMFGADDVPAKADVAGIVSFNSKVSTKLVVTSLIAGILMVVGVVAALLVKIVNKKQQFLIKVIAAAALIAGAVLAIALTKGTFISANELGDSAKDYYSLGIGVRAWGNHTQDGYGINREHLWAKSEGFDDDSSGAGARGDPMHLVAANGWANNQHNNNFYGYVDTTKSYTDTSTKYSSVGHNLLGPSKTHPADGVVVFEPQDADKGDIARAMFYMVARYNNLAGDDTTIGGANPNLALTNDLTKWKSKGYTSTGTEQGFMGVMDDLLEWNKLDPVDEYEIHRNNILFKNFTFNRNPFIDYPEWADIIWGDAAKAANPASDPLNGGNPNAISDFVVNNVNYGTEVNPTATAITGTVTFGYSRNENGPFTSEKPTEAGVWYCEAKSAAEGDYSADTAVVSFKIIGTPNTVTIEISEDIKEGSVIAPTGTALEGDVTFVYSDKEEGPYTSTVPSEPGTYWVKGISVNSGEYVKRINSIRIS